MPYFIREPYAAPLRKAETGEMPDILALADQVLALETGLPGAAPFRIRAPLRPGSIGSLVLGCSAEQAPVAIRFAVSDLTGPGGMIASQCLNVDPPDLALAPGEAADVTVSIAVPAEAMPGLYQGRLTSAGSDHGFAAPLEIIVAP